MDHKKINGPSRLKVSHLKAGYSGKVVLEDVSMDVAEGEIRIILGASGCGKSTLLKTIIGLEKPLGGEIELLGSKVDWSLGRPADDIVKRMGVLFQGGALLSSLTVGENVALPMKIHNPGLPDEVVEELVRLKLSQVKLGHAYDKLPNELSGGMRKRAGLARAIVNDPDLLFCDEPSAGLDPVTSRSLDELLLELRSTLGITMVVVTHELDSIRTLCDRMTFLGSGKVVFDGTLKEAEARGPKEVNDFLDRKGETVVQNGRKIAFNLEDG
ncbi:MAG: ATP-binding cassette domain-containing protein [Fibrobacterota bacterium]|nr:ATP-binding cassette domain-containing protein [Fibrobacterota bacterium]